MGNLKGVKFNLPDKAKFYFNDSRGNLKNIFSSDQLFSAIINSASLLYSNDKVSEIIQSFREDEVLISSLYYGLDFFKGSEAPELVKSIFFLPKPYGSIFPDQSQMENGEVTLQKKVKRLTFVSTDIYQQLLREWKADEQRFNFDLTILPTIGETFAYRAEELENLKVRDSLSKCKFLTTQTVQKLQVNRFSNSSDTTYYQNVMEISSIKIDSYEVKPFMYFVYRGSLGNELLASIRLLADEGIGGQRSRGLGYFTSVEEVEVPLEDSDSGPFYISLSVVFPEEEELDHTLSYQLSERSGYIYDCGGTTLRRCTTRVMNEGCLFDSPVKGKIVDVTPHLSVKKSFEHDILLNGKAFLIGFGGNLA